MCFCVSLFICCFVSLLRCFFVSLFLRLCAVRGVTRGADNFFGMYVCGLGCAVVGNGNGTCPLKTNPKIRYSCELAKPLGTPYHSYQWGGGRSGLNPQLVQNAEWVLLKPLRSPSSQLGFNQNSFLKSLAVLFGERRKKVIAFWNLDNNWLPNLGNCGSFKNIFRTLRNPG